MLDLCPNFPQKLFSISLANALNPGLFFMLLSRPGEWKPELGDYLEDRTDEVPDNRIIEFVTGGTRIWSLVNMSKYSAGSDMYFI
jgi:hypothetical protein